MASSQSKKCNNMYQRRVFYFKASSRIKPVIFQSRCTKNLKKPRIRILKFLCTAVHEKEKAAEKKIIR